MPSFLHIAATVIEKTFQTSFAQGSGTTQTFTGVAFGSAAGDREVFVVITGLAFASAPAVSAVTIGGVTATLSAAKTASIGGYGFTARVAFATVPSGTTGNIVVTWSSSPSQGSVAVYSVTGRAVLGAAETASGSAALTSAGTSVAITGMSVPSGGFTLGVLFNFSAISAPGVSGLAMAHDATAQTYAKFASNPVQASAGSGTITWTWTTNTTALAAAWSFN